MKCLNCNNSLPQFSIVIGKKFCCRECETKYSDYKGKFQEGFGGDVNDLFGQLFKTPRK